MPLLAGEDKGTVLANQPAPAEEGEPKAAAGLKLPSGGGPRGHVTPAGQEGPVLGLPVHFI